MEVPRLKSQGCPMHPCKRWTLMHTLTTARPAAIIGYDLLPVTARGDRVAQAVRLTSRSDASEKCTGLTAQHILGHNLGLASFQEELSIQNERF